MYFTLLRFYCGFSIQESNDTKNTDIAGDIKLCSNVLPMQLRTLV